jgi:hypothetical protein
MSSTLGSSHLAPWRSLYRVGAIAAFTSVALIPIQIVFYILTPPPATVAGWFALLQARPLAGLVAMDLLYLANNVAMMLLYLALFAALFRAAPSLMTIALALGLVGMAAYFASNPMFEMLDLAQQHAAAGTAGERDLLLAAGHATLARMTGTAFDAYYVLSAIALLLIGVAVLRTGTFSRAAGLTGLIGGIAMLVPSSAGTLGLIFAFASLVPWAAFAILVGLHLLHLK